MTAPLRVGIVGVGWGALVHGPAYQLVDGYELKAICGRRPEPLARAAGRLDIADTATDWESFVRRDDLDLISIALPVDLHKPVFLAALEAGKHVLCEKPLCATAEEGREMLAAAEASDRQTAVCYETRWASERLVAWEHVAEGRLGKPYFGQITKTASYWHPSHAPQSGWMYRLEEGGGYLNASVSHDIDYLQALFGPVAAVCADIQTSIPEITLANGEEIAVTADDSCALIMRMRSGALAVITNSVVGKNADSRLLIAFGSKGSVEAFQAAGEGPTLVSGKDDDRARPMPLEDRPLRSGGEVPARRSGRQIRAQALMLEEWLPAFSGNPTKVPTVREALHVQHVIDAARRSSAGEGWVAVTD
jgi:predicted dehydrogenase